MKLQEALKETGKASRKGLDWFIEECENGEHNYRAISSTSGGVAGYDMLIHHALADDWQPYHEVKEIRPEKAGELWKDEDGKRWATRPSGTKGEISIDSLSTCGTEWRKYDVNIWHGNIIHNKNGWTRLFPKVEDDSVKRIEFENVDWNLSDCWQTKPMPFVSYNGGSSDWGGIRDAVVNQPKMKMILEIPKDKL